MIAVIPCVVHDSEDNPSLVLPCPAVAVKLCCCSHFHRCLFGSMQCHFCDAPFLWCYGRCCFLLLLIPSGFCLSATPCFSLFRWLSENGWCLFPLFFCSYTNAFLICFACLHKPNASIFDNNLVTVFLLIYIGVFRFCVHLPALSLARWEKA